MNQNKNLREEKQFRNTFKKLEPYKLICSVRNSDIQMWLNNLWTEIEW